ncbi:MAG: phosphoglucose isomerase [Rickettsiaceae bacterium]|jgi:glucose-6-phosphate isomerase|nr:phosphoglucose isomerase [Rickettsiaceae bacterium]
MINFHSIFATINDEISKNQLPFFDLSQIDIEEIKAYSNEIRSNFQTLLVVGTGASVINARAIISCIAEPTFDVRFLDNLDPITINRTIQSLSNRTTAILVISKSGNTHETIALLNHLADSLITTNNLYIITEEKESELTSLGQKYNANFIAHPKDIGGRFAMFTAVGLLPASIAGVDLLKFIKFAKDYLQSLSLEELALKEFVEWILNNVENNKNCFILMHYGDQLVGLFEWVRQIYAESLGKNAFGFTPVISRGTIDQHSQLQLYLDGPDDKFYTLVALDNSTQHSSNSANLNSLFLMHAESTYQALQECKRPVKYNKVENTYAYVAANIIQTMLAVIIIGRLKSINPFDQPAVEIGKKYIRLMEKEPNTN